MKESKDKNPPITEKSATATDSDPQPSDSVGSSNQPTIDPQESRRWWIKLFVQPALLLACGVILIVGLGVAQRLGFISSGGSADTSQASTSGAAAQYICPMLCTPPLSEPGRCPVCAMELVKSTSSSGKSDSRSVMIDPASRRLANIRTVAVKSILMSRTLQAIGELRYDEGTLKTISAYVDGRLDRLYADYTGVVVKKGDRLALVYSPRLYSGQVELLLAKKAREASQSSILPRVVQSSRDLYESAKQRLIELGMTSSQIEQLEKAGKANSRMHLSAPISGTVIEKLASEGQYVKEGQAIYKLADLSTVWLMLELFPEDAAMIRYGQKVEAEVQSLQGRKFTGRVAFIDPNVDPQTRTVGVRVVLPNQDGALRIGDYAKASISISLGKFSDPQYGVYDPELANKWISPRHPHVVRDSPGECPLCGVALVPAANFGFLNDPSEQGEVLVVPRNAVLMAGNNSVVYVETELGRFEMRRVVWSVGSGDQIVILKGLKKGEQVAEQGNFLIDSQMQLAGNPSLIDPTKVVPGSIDFMPEEIIAALAKLSPEDRLLAESQRICPVTKLSLGSMGTPPKIDLQGTPVFICCPRCRTDLLKDPEKHLAILADAQKTDYSSESLPELDFPSIGVPQLIDPDSSLPSIGSPQPIDEDAGESEKMPTKNAKHLAKQPKENLR